MTAYPMYIMGVVFISLAPARPIEVRWLIDRKTLSMRGYVFIFRETDVWKSVE